jgi:hypothetical protein
MRGAGRDKENEWLCEDRVQEREFGSPWQAASSPEASSEMEVTFKRIRGVLLVQKGAGWT